jgi:ribose transport system substrate-binding protein
MSITIKDIARQAGVSIATVSHVINKTRYVSPEVTAKVEECIEKTGYRQKIIGKEKKLRNGKLSEIAFVVPNIGGTIYSQLIAVLSRHFSESGYLLSVYLTNDDLERERHILSGLLANKRIAGIILAPTSDKESNYSKLAAANIPLVCLEKAVKSDQIDCVLSENMQAIYLATVHLIKSGHENIALLIEKKPSVTVEERLGGYKKALAEYGLKYRENLVIRIDLYNENVQEIQDICEKDIPTAFVAGGNKLTLVLLRTLENMGLTCPQDVSVIGFGDEQWCELVIPPLTILKQDTEELGRLAAVKILHKIQGKDDCQHEIRVPVNLSIRKSTQIIGRGPFGEKAVSPDEIKLSDDEKAELLAGGYKVGISFHYSGTTWTRLHENAIRYTLEKYGVKVVAVTDAHFDPLLQVTQLDSIKMQEPDAIISIPVDDKITAQKFKEISKDTKLIFISNIPEGFKKEDYACCVSVNERENGQNAGIILGELFKDKKRAKIGMLNHGAPFYGTHLRDMMAEQVIRDNYHNIEIVDIRHFYEIERAYEVCRQMMIEHSDLEGLYISWDQPALEAIRALQELHREDISIVTCDLDVEISTYMANGKMVRGLSTQRFYEQGEAVALVTAKALLGNRQYKYVGVEPYVVLPKNLLRAWKDIIHEPVPERLEKAASKKFT